MPNNFRKQLTETAGTNGFYYVSKAGVSANAGNTAESPLPSVQELCDKFPGSISGALGANTYNDGAGMLLVGAGVYTGEILSGVPHRMVGDGKVVWNVNGRLYVGTKHDAAANEPYVVANMVFNFITEFRGGLSQGGHGTSNQRFCGWQNCSLSFVANGTLNVNAFGNTTFIDSIIERMNGPRQAFRYSIALDSKIYACPEFKNSYLDANSFLELTSVSALASSNIQGQIRVLDDVYGFTDLATFKQNYNLQGRNDLINQPPLFNNVLRRDYSLRLLSPHLSLGIGPRHLRYAQSWFVASTAAVGAACTPGNTYLVNTADGSIINFLFLEGFSWSQQGSLYITENTANNFIARYRTAPLQIASVAQILKFLPVLSGYNFDTDFPALESAFDANQPDPQNNNVVAVNNFTSGAAGRSPHRPTISLRWSTRQSPQDNVSTDWITGSSFLPFEVDAEPTWNQATSKGNGDPDFNASPGSIQPVRALWVQIEAIVRNNFYSR